MSNTAFYGISIFACGAIFGAAVSMTYFKKKYETNSVKENFKKESKENSEKTISEEEILVIIGEADKILDTFKSAYYVN